MIEHSGTAYEWVRALHLISVIAWMAGLLYLPRLYVYHAEAEAGSDKSETFKVMERRLLRAIMTPAMVASFVFGGLLLTAQGPVDAWPLWLWVKLALVLIMAGAHGFQAKWRKGFERDANPHSTTFYRAMNEVPTLLMIVIVILAVVKPF